MKTILLALVTTIGLGIGEPALADDDNTFVTVKSTTTARAERLQLSGRIAAPFTPRGDAVLAENCISDRRVVVAIKRPSGFRTVATDLTSSAGVWSVRVREFDARYRIVVEPSEFAYSPRYGQLETVRCLGTTATGRLTRRGFKLDASVLGERFSRATAVAQGASTSRNDRAALPRTGWSATLYAIVGTCLVLLGIVLLRSVPKGRARPSCN